VQTAASVSTVSESVVYMKVIQCSRVFSILLNVWAPRRHLYFELVVGLVRS